MRAARLHELGGLPQVDDVDPPAAGDGELLEVSASTLNPVDITIGNGTFYGGTPPFPYVIGSEAVGRTADGKRLWYYAGQTMAEQVPITEPARAIEIPDGVDDATALACGIAGVTGWLAVARRAGVTAGDTVLVLGASGTLGCVAVQGAKLLGAERVIGAARHVENIPEAADERIALTGEYTLPAATVVVDALWGEPGARALEAAARGVRFVQLGQSAGPTATLASGWVRGKVANILGHSLFATPREVIVDGYRTLCEHARDGRISFETETFAFGDIAKAWERQASGSPRAKIVVPVR
jgi:NADPH:quinone reductase-like Zn-dependent oxidoreductase